MEYKGTGYRATMEIIRRQRTVEERRRQQRELNALPGRKEHRRRLVMEHQLRVRAGLPPQKTGGGPGDSDHPRRCTALCKWRGKRCRQWALVGRTTCKYHAGNVPTGRDFDMPGKYSKYLGPTLRAAMEQVVGSQSHQEMLQLYEEIGLSRAMLAESLKLASIAFDNEKSTAEIKALAGKMVREGIDQVAELCSKMAAIEQRAEDVVSVRQLGIFIEQIIGAVYEELGDDVESAKRLADTLAKRLRLPGKDQRPNDIGKVAVRLIDAPRTGQRQDGSDGGAAAPAA